jgi:hypothetical protein
MGDMITKPDANPILYAVLNLILCGLPIGTFMMGQSNKAIMLIVYWFVLNLFGLGFIISVLAALDAYKLGQKLQSGESIGQKENGFELFNSLPLLH